MEGSERIIVLAKQVLSQLSHTPSCRFTPRLPGFQPGAHRALSELATFEITAISQIQHQNRFDAYGARRSARKTEQFGSRSNPKAPRFSEPEVLWSKL
jgi:hypothetical protein